MSDPYLGQVIIAGFNYAPRGYAECNGALIQINQNQALFALLGTTFGGDGIRTYGLPNLQSRVPVHPGNGIMQGQAGGLEAVTLTTNEMPMHSHSANVGADASQLSPAGGILAKANIPVYANGTPDVTLSTDMVQNTGTGQGHENVQPSLALNFCIALEGVFPSRN